MRPAYMRWIEYISMEYICQNEYIRWHGEASNFRYGAVLSGTRR
ncbi:hypothetical protein ACPOL_0833 [Acidisarcina polymorpha]|uniref:Uncharacterized protein n=1 Tax=Acidisarcina polymorpha TaxID=2211140 RepID=A0A2Z5FU22_9BACT|nr:hypothetical protein ACPOL_0833 [Acidisarcina polymorpha]